MFWNLSAIVYLVGTTPIFALFVTRPIDFAAQVTGQVLLNGFLDC